MNPTIALEEIYAPIESAIQAIPDVTLGILATPNPLAQEVIQYFFSEQGKLLRPALTLFGAEIVRQNKGPGAANPDKSHLMRLAAAFEIFHAATLVHDDIVDSAYLRRNLPTVNVRWGPQIAVLVGDYLHVRAVEAFFETKNEKIAARFMETAGAVCDGEIRELREKYNLNLTQADYFDILGKKTASLLSCCIEAGAILAEGSPQEAGALGRYGHYFGLAFQIVDDCLDFTGEEHEFGKTLGADYTAGVLTLPLIRLLEIARPRDRETVIAAFKSNKELSKFQMILELIREYQTVPYALAQARAFSAKARAELNLFSDSPAKRSLDRLLDYVLERNR